MVREDPPDPDAQRTRTFPDAREIHEEILDHPDRYLDGWVEQARFRERYDLPPFRPPRFEDGTEVHDVLDELETRYGVSITFAARGGEHGFQGGDWNVVVDGDPAFSIDRHRDDGANTVIEHGSDDFRRRIVSEHVD